ncbi:unnamed protein product [Urochloa humidicola]
MENRPAAIRPRRQPQRAIAARRVRRLLINSGTLLMSAAGSAIILHTAAREGRGGPCPYDDADGADHEAPAAAYLLVAFSVALLGVWLALLAPVAGQFPRAARVGVSIATALCRRLLGLR